MTIREQQKFIENFEKILEKKSKHYRRYTGNRQHHNFTVSQAGLERGVKDTLEFSLAGNKEKSSLVHAKQQQKISHKYNLSDDYINYNSKISINIEVYNQLFNTKDKKINENLYNSGSFYRFFTNTIKNLHLLLELQ